MLVKVYISFGVIAAVAIAAMMAVCNNLTEQREQLTTAMDTLSQLYEKRGTRYAMITGLRPDKIVRYKELHANVWPEVLQKIKECNIQNYSIHLREIEGKHYLFSYFEYTGTDFTHDMARMAADTTTQHWWRETAPLQIPLPDAATKNETWSNLEEVFFQQ